jgi:hypothetical protein
MFTEIYRKAKRINSLTKGREAVDSCIESFGIKTYSITEAKISEFREIQGYKIIIQNETAFFPQRLLPQKEQNRVSKMRSIFLDVELVVPP